MLRATRRRIGAPAWLAFGLVVGLPALAEAQLFPNRTIKRQREGCAAEPPFNAHVRRDYYGYYPTCWSKFPDGWQCPCPNPELPDAAASFRKYPREVPPDPGPLGPGPDQGDPGMTDDAPPAQEGAPPLPDPGRSPFNMDNRPIPGGRPSNPANPGAGGAPGLPTTPDPSLPPRGASLSAPVSESPATAVGLLEMPELPPPSLVARTNLDPGAMILAPEVTQASARDLGPLPVAAQPSTSVPTDSDSVLGATAPAQAPQRRSILGGLFNSGNKRRR